MKITTVNNPNFNGIKLKNNSYNYSKIIADILQSDGVYVSGHKTYFTCNDFNSKRNILDYVRCHYNFNSIKCGFIFFPWSRECWIVSNKSFEQKIKKILDNHNIDTEINLGI